jgi:hypothetical protein
MSKVVTDFWIWMGVATLVVVGFWMAERAGTTSGSAWIAAGAGVALALAVAFLMRLSRPDEEEDEPFEKFMANGGIFPTGAALAICLAVAGLGAHFILDFGADELGHLDYSRPAMGGFWIGVSIFAIWNIIMTHKSKVAP